MNAKNTQLYENKKQRSPKDKKNVRKNVKTRKLNHKWARRSPENNKKIPSMFKKLNEKREENRDRKFSQSKNIIEEIEENEKVEDVEERKCENLKKN